MSNIVAFTRPVNGVKVEQRADDGFINGTAMCVAHNRDISDWLKTDDVLEMVDALAQDLGLESKDHKSGNSVYTRVSSAFPDLVRVKRGSPSSGGGTWIHPDLAVYLAQWCNKSFAILVGRWVREWIITGLNPVDVDPEEQYRLWQQRYDIRIELKDVLRPELMNSVVDYAHRHKLGAKRLCIAVHDEMNRCIQGDSASGIRALGGLPLGDLLRDYFEASPLVCYSAINKIATNAIVDRDVEPLQAVREACESYLGKSYVPEPVELVENIYTQGKRLRAAQTRKRLKEGVQLDLLTDAS